MRTATLFELKKRTVAVGGADFVRKYAMSMPYDLSRDIGNGEAVMPINEVDLPIEHIRRIEHGVMKNHFIALDTDLREILEAPFTSEIERLGMALASSQVAARAYSNAHNILRKRIDGFNRLPWYKRLFARP